MLLLLVTALFEAKIGDTVIMLLLITIKIINTVISPPIGGQ